MRDATTHFDAMRNSSRLRAIEARVWSDYNRAYARADIPHGLRHARRLEMIEHKLWTNAPSGISTFNEFD